MQINTNCIVIYVGDENNDLSGRLIRMSRSASTSSLPCLPLEESWFLTPPPCFTSTPPSGLESSPLENLLIEHPSMSVYHRARSASPPLTSPLPSPPAHQTNHRHPLVSVPPSRTSPPPAQQPQQRHPLLPVPEQLALHCLELKAASKVSSFFYLTYFY